MKTTIIYGALTGILMAASMNAAAMDFCAQSSKPDVCYGAQVRMLDSVRVERDNKVRQSTAVNQEWKDWWFREEHRFEQWVNTHCGNSACVKDQLERRNNWSYWKLQSKGIIK
jgi:hypothetical protein